MAAGQGRCPYQISGYLRDVDSPVCYFMIIKLLYSSLLNSNEISTSIFEEKINLFERYSNFSSYQAVNTLPVNFKDQHVMEVPLFILWIRTSK